MITRDDWLAALHDMDGQSDDPEALSVREFAAALGFGRSAAMRRLAWLVKEGKAVQVVKLVCRPDGGRVRVPAFRLTPITTPSLQKKRKGHETRRPGRRA
jgi:hypothetical protein